ncbi:MAG: hypothetical protein ACRCTZ_16040 [Sarcina sp.]
MKKYNEITKEEAQVIANGASKKEKMKTTFSEEDFRKYCSLINIEIEEIDKNQSNKGWDVNGKLILVQQYANLIFIQHNSKVHYLLREEV